MPKNLLNYTFWAALELNNDTHPSGKKIQLFNQIFFHFTHLDKEHNQAWIYFHCLYMHSLKTNLPCSLMYYTYHVTCFCLYQ